MAKQTIGIGTTANDGTGDPARTAFDKVNDNFTELYGKQAGIYSPFEYGAIGNGTADDTAAIQAAVDAIEAETGGILELPPTYEFKITAPIVLSGASSIWINGTWKSVIVNAGTGNAFTVGNTSTDQTADIRFLGFAIEGNASSLCGINLKRMHSARIEGCKIYSHGTDGVKLESSYACWVLNNYINNNTGCGIYAVAQSGVGNDFIQVVGNKVLANAGTAGIFIDNSAYGPKGQRVEHNDIEGNVIGMKLDVGSTSNTSNFTFDKNYLENQSGYNVSLAEDGGSSLLKSCTVTFNTINTGGGTSAANAVRIGSKAREVVYVGNAHGNVDLVINSSATVGLFSGNSGGGSFTGGFDSTGGSTVSQLRFIQTGGGYSALDMSGDRVRCNYPFQTGGPVLPASANTATYQTACSIWAGTGAPNNANGADGDYYFRSDTPGTSNQRVYVRSGGSWTGIV